MKDLWMRSARARPGSCPVAETDFGEPRTRGRRTWTRGAGLRSSSLAIRDIIRFGDPRLLAANADADPAVEDLSGLIADMIATCHAAPGVGLAAPQIGVNKRLAIIDLSIGADPEAVVVLINPLVLETFGEQKEEEGCLSVPDFSETVLRPEQVRVRAGDASGAMREIEGTGMLARALCHEIDHLNGLLFIDRLRGLKRELTWRKVHRQKTKGIW